MTNLISIRQLIQHLQSKPPVAKFGDENFFACLTPDRVTDKFGRFVAQKLQSSNPELYDQMLWDFAELQARDNQNPSKRLNPRGHSDNGTPHKSGLSRILPVKRKKGARLTKEVVAEILASEMADWEIYDWYEITAGTLKAIRNGTHFTQKNKV